MSNRPSRKFEYIAAVRKAVPLIIGINGPSGCGKTFSGLRLATGIQRVVGGDIAGIDTESNRMLHYADKFTFKHIPFGAPFSPDDYLDALNFAVDQGARTIVVDSASHLHDGPGGILEMHEEDLQAQKKRGRDDDGEGGNSYAAWVRPKGMLRKFINAMITGLGSKPDPEKPINLVLCFRGKNKLKLIPGQKKPTNLGLQPIADPELRFEMTTNILLYNGSRGAPTWTSPIPGEMDVIKLPDPFVDMFGARSQLDEAAGEKMALWSTGGAAPKFNVDAKISKTTNDWMAFFAKRQIDPATVLAHLGKKSLEHIDSHDHNALSALQKRVIAKETTWAQALATSAPVDEPDPVDEEEANRRAAEPTEEEMQRLANAAGTTTTTGA